MLPVIWLPKALDQLEEIGRYIAARNPSAADRMQALIERTAESLPPYPYLHRAGRVPETREAFAHPNYILVYRVDADAIRIVAILHARQNYP